MSQRSIRVSDLLLSNDQQRKKAYRALFASALGLIACGDAGVANELVSTNGLRQALHAPPESLTDCIQRHITESGSADAVTTLSCPGDKDASCEPPDLTQLSSLHNLTTLDLSYRCVSNADAITKLTKLEHLELSGNNLENIEPLGALRELRTLGLAGNGITASWGFRSQRPFSQWSKLEELNLSETGISNILPLSYLTSLRTLHVESCNLYSLRPLGPLSGLRELHADHNSFDDLSALAGMTQLEMLTASHNDIRSLEPLRRLAQNGSLRSVSLDATCVSSCGELADAEVSCANPRSSCENWEMSATGQNLSVPFEYVEQLVPPVDFPVWTEDQVKSGFELVSTDPDIRWDQARSGCDARADAASKRLLESDFPALTKVYAYGNLRTLTTNDPSEFYWFDWHVAAAVRTDRGFLVFDPALEPRPLTMSEWYERLVDSRGTDGNFSCTDYYARHTSPQSVCESNVDENGDLLVDEVQNLRGAICNSLECSP